MDRRQLLFGGAALAASVTQAKAQILLSKVGPGSFGAGGSPAPGPTVFGAPGWPAEPTAHDIAAV